MTAGERAPILLEICIPTYNRSRFLDRILSQVSAQVLEHQLDGQVRVHVSDNASTDDTRSVIEKWRGQRGDWSFSKHTANIGAAANYMYLVNASRARYVWLFGDDDEFVGNHGLVDVVESLVACRPALLVLSSVGGVGGENGHRSFPQLSEYADDAIRRDVDIFRRLTWITANVFRPELMSLGLTAPGLEREAYIQAFCLWSGMSKINGHVCELTNLLVQPASQNGFRQEGTFPSQKNIRQEHYRLYSYLAYSFREPLLRKYAASKYCPPMPGLARLLFEIEVTLKARFRMSKLRRP